MSHITTTLTQLALLTTALVLALTLNYAFAAPWVGPPGVAPTNNVAMPLNVTNTPQVKDGNVSVGASGNTNTTIGLSTYGASVVKGWQTLGGITAPTQLLDLKGTPGTDGIKFPDGTVQVSAAKVGTIFTSRYGSGRRCAGDAWISACEYTPGATWEYNTCYSRGHAASYGWTLNWVPAVSGYQAVGYGAGARFDVTCDI